MKSIKGSTSTKPFRRPTIGGTAMLAFGQRELERAADVQALPEPFDAEADLPLDEEVA